MIKNFFKDSIVFIILISLQILIFNNIQFSGLINPYIYILFIILLPFELAGGLLLLLAFFTGLTMDLFMNTPGVHVMACLVAAFFRPRILDALSPRDGYETGSKPRIHYYGMLWFLKYAFLIITIHHIVLFYTEIFRWSDFFITLFRALLSSVFTLIIIIISQYFVFRR